jgi:hypothetical protein
MLKILRDKLPEEWTSKKMSKLEILKKSTLYISRLTDLTKEQSSATRIKHNDNQTSGSEGLESDQRRVFGMDGVDIFRTERISTRTRRDGSVSSEEMMEETRFSSTDSEIGDNNHPLDSFDGFNTSEELMHVGTFIRT